PLCAGFGRHREAQLQPRRKKRRSGCCPFRALPATRKADTLAMEWRKRSARSFPGFSRWWWRLTPRLKTAQKQPKEIAEDLQVRYLVDGSVRKAGPQVKVNVRLFDAASGSQVWADDFVGEMK